MKTNRKRRANHKAKARREDRAQNKPHNRADWQRKRARYLQRARAASEAGDRIEAENCYQHADHYLRLIAGTAA